MTIDDPKIRALIARLSADRNILRIVLENCQAALLASVSPDAADRYTALGQAAETLARTKMLALDEEILEMFRQDPEFAAACKLNIAPAPADAQAVPPAEPLAKVLSIAGATSPVEEPKAPEGGGKKA